MIRKSNDFEKLLAKQIAIKVKELSGNINFLGSIEKELAEIMPIIVSVIEKEKLS